MDTSGTPESSRQLSVGSNNKRKRTESSDDGNDTEEVRPKKRTCSPPTPIDITSNESYCCSTSDLLNSSECYSTTVEYDLTTALSPNSIPESLDTPTHQRENIVITGEREKTISNSQNFIMIRHSNEDDDTSNSNKNDNNVVVDDEDNDTTKCDPTYSSCCDTPVTDSRICPLPVLSWADSTDVWKLMVAKDEQISRARNSKKLCIHPGILPRMRAILLDWLIEVCEVYKLHRETYYLAVDYLDRFLSSNVIIHKSRLQLLGITCLFVASKVEEIYPPKIGEFAYVTDGACQEQDILQQERILLNALEWNLTPVTIMGWLGVYMQLQITCRSPPPPPLPSKYNDVMCKNSNINNSKLSIIKSSEINEKTPKKSEINVPVVLTTSAGGINSAFGATEEFDDGNSDCEDEKNNLKCDETFVYTQFSGMEFCQTAQLLDLCSLDIGLADHPYSVIAAAAISLIFNRETAICVSGLDWDIMEPCVRWMKPFYQSICEDPTDICLLEQNEQIQTSYGLSFICPNIVTDDSHIIQTHTITLNMFDKALEKRSNIDLAPSTSTTNNCIMSNSNTEQQEASPLPQSSNLINLPELLTPPASSRKPLGDTNLIDNNNEIVTTNRTLKTL